MMDPISNFPAVSPHNSVFAQNPIPITLTPPPIIIYATEEFKKPYDRPTPQDLTCLCGSTFAISRHYHRHMLACRVLRHAELRPNPKYDTQEDARQESSS